MNTSLWCQMRNFPYLSSMVRILGVRVTDVVCGLSHVMSHHVGKCALEYTLRSKIWMSCKDKSIQYVCICNIIINITIIIYNTQSKTTQRSPDEASPQRYSDETDYCILPKDPRMHSPERYLDEAVFIPKIRGLRMCSLFTPKIRV